MLKLINITKNYELKDQEPVRALRGITLSFRPNEFVAILGASGCGKTTLLNIIGGLDKYSSGNLFIKGRSTKRFNDYDWDTYRNHSVGFVFQSYNLIPHQSVLANVELSLTIAGVKKRERRERAYLALAKVGLKGMEHKRPNQLSGGQMQRVAIARALVNDPEILLADEPTGALDSETSIQIMDLLKEVAKDRLVIMVTHNPDLAYAYASRIVKMSDGQIIDDSNPFVGLNAEELKKYRELETKTYKKKYSSMSFRTAFGLSLSNLFNKIKRTILVMIAGSIGIIGVSAVLSVSNGIKGYISDMQNDMLSSYPIEIEEQSVDYTSLMTGLSSWNKKEVLNFDVTTKVGIDSMIDYLMSAYKDVTSIKTNDINEDLLSYINAISDNDAAVILEDYGIDVTNNIFTKWNVDEKDQYISLNGLTQRYIQELKTVDGFSSYATYVDLFTDFMKQLPDNPSYLLDQYDLLGDSKMATEANEIVLVVDENTTLTDIVFAQLGILNHDEFLNLAKKAIEENDENNTLSKDELDQLYPYPSTFDYSDLIGREFYYLPHDEIYSYGDISNRTYTEISVVLEKDGHIFTLNYDESTDSLSGVYIETSPFSYQIVYLQRQSEKNLEAENEQIVDGTWVGIIGDMNHYVMININQASSMMNNVIYFIDDLKNFNPMTTMPNVYSMQVNANEKHEYVYGYRYSASQDEETVTSTKAVKMKIVGILRAKKDTNFGSLTSGVYYTKAFSQMFMDDAQNSDIICNSNFGFKKYIGSDEEKSKLFNAYVTYDYYDYSGDEGVLKSSYSSALNSDLGSSFSSLFSSLSGVDYFSSDCEHLRSLCGLKVIDNQNSYSFSSLPKQIKIYPIDFDAKDNITAYLDNWNSSNDIKLDSKTIKAESRSEITYKDTIEIIVSVINTLVDTITVALVAFTSLSLVVSCFMIAVITYISVMERVKEIGVIRSLGGRKKDVSRLFIAENLITGLSSGIFGVVITLLLCILINSIVSVFGVTNIGALTWKIAIIMTSLSVFLSVISGLIPSVRSSNQDPVIALRSE